MFSLSKAVPFLISKAQKDYLDAHKAAEAWGINLVDIDPLEQTDLMEKVLSVYKAVGFSLAKPHNFFAPYGYYLTALYAKANGDILMGGHEGLAHADYRVHDMEYAGYESIYAQIPEDISEDAKKNCAYIGFMNCSIKWPSTGLSPETYYWAQINNYVGVSSIAPFYTKYITENLAFLPPKYRIRQDGWGEKPILRMLMKKVAPWSGWDSRKMWMENWSLDIRKGTALDKENILSYQSLNVLRKGVHSADPKNIGVVKFR